MNNYSLWGQVGEGVNATVDTAYSNAQKLQNLGGLGRGEKTGKIVEFIDTIQTRENAQKPFQTERVKEMLKAMAERQSQIKALQPSKGGPQSVSAVDTTASIGSSHYNSHKQLEEWEWEGIKKSMHIP